MVRHNDCSLVGYLTLRRRLDDVVQMFSRGDKRRAERLISIYSYADTSDERVLSMAEAFNR